MRVKNAIIYMEQPYEGKAEKKLQKSVYAGGLNERQDAISIKKQRAQKQALEIVGDAFTVDKKLDEQQNTHRENVKELTEQLHEMRGYIEAQHNMPEEEMTAEMKEAQKEAIFEYEKQYAAIKNEIRAENASIEAISQERLKNAPMAEAQKAAEEIIETAGEEVVDMLFQEAKEHIDEEQKEKAEQAEKVAEKRQEEEEKIAEAGKEQEEAKVRAEMIKQTAVDETEKEIQEMLNKLKLLEEDIKGAAVDKVL